MIPTPDKMFTFSDFGLTDLDDGDKLPILKSSGFGKYVTRDEIADAVAMHAIEVSTDITIDASQYLSDLYIKASNTTAIEITITNHLPAGRKITIDTIAATAGVEVTQGGSTITIGAPRYVLWSRGTTWIAEGNRSVITSAVEGVLVPGVNIVDAGFGTKSLTLPDETISGRVIDIIALSQCKIVQSLSEQVISHRRSIFTTKGVGGYLTFKHGDSARLTFRKTGLSHISPPVKINNPDTLPSLNGLGCAWSPGGRYLAVAHNFSPFVTIYDWATGSPVKIANPATLPTGDGRGCAWSPDGLYLAVAHSSSPFVTIYDWSSGAPVKINNPGDLPTEVGLGCAWSPDGRYLAVAHNVSPFVTIYDWATGSPVKIANPATLPTGNGLGCAWSPDSRYLAVAHTSSPFVTIYDWATGSPVKINNPGDLPTGVGLGCAWSPDSRYLAVAHTTSPFLTIYDWSSGAPVKITNPATLPTGTGYGSAWSPDGRYLVIAHSTSPFITIYDWATGSPVKVANPATLPTGNGYGCAWSPDGRYLAVAHYMSPYITIYDSMITASKSWEISFINRLNECDAAFAARFH